MPKRQLYTQKCAIQLNTGTSMSEHGYSAAARTKRNLLQSGLGEPRLPCICFISMSPQSRYLVGTSRSTKTVMLQLPYDVTIMQPTKPGYGWNHFCKWAPFPGQKMEAVCSSKATKNFYRSTHIKWHVPKDGNLRSDCHKNQRSRDGCLGTMVTIDFLVILTTKV